MILVRDPEGVCEEELLISREVAYVLLLLDGSRSLRDIQVEYMRAFGELIYMERLDELVSYLDERFLLFSPRYEKRREELKGEYEKKTERPPALAGKSYPADPRELMSFLTHLFARSAETKCGSTNIRGILSPHIDYGRGAEVYSTTYPHLRDIAAKLVVVFGTSHRPLKRLWAVSLKDFVSPLGRVLVPRQLKEIINRSSLSRYIDEWPHRLEHSIELQIPLLQFFLNDDFTVFPVLMGGMEDFVTGRRSGNDQEVEDLLASLTSCLEKFGRPYILLSAADLAHIGFQFGDMGPLGANVLEKSRRRDEMLLECIRKCDADGFLELIKEERDSRRICGLAPIYFQLRLLRGSRGEIVSYKQWTDGLSSVSFAGGVFYG
ncbi:MAG: AmmeMemoRadiSam system protein B [Syntrophales bacterium]|nr:AmmeMemoRadiSam system protein B [Syntrophales bacterium]